MFSWIFKKKKIATPVAATPTAQVTAQAAESAKQARQANATVWSDRVSRALGDDNALLALAKDAPSVDVKLAAVRALTQETTLKLAEREFRTHDRRVHQVAKQRHAEVKALRETNERAADLLRHGAALLGEPLIPANRLVELDRSWQALDAALISPDQQAAFEALSAKLTATLQAHTEHKATVQRWTAQARQTITQVHATCLTTAAKRPSSDELAQAHDAVQQALNTMPDDAGLAVLRTSLQSAQSDVIAMLEEPVAQPEPLPQPVATEPPTAEPPAAKRAPAREKPQRMTADTKAAIDALLSQAEAALAEGQVAQAHQPLTALDTLGPLEAAQRTRLTFAQAEVARLKGWQQWGGGLARDELVLDSEALAKATAAEAGSPPPMQIKAHAEAIDDLRRRWKELDRLKAATSQPLWERFDKALQAAYLPVAAHLAQMEAERQSNLAQRHALLDALDAAPLPNGSEPAAALDDTSAEHAPWKDVIRALDQFQTAWRKLGPVEHTTPRKAQKTLFERMSASLARLESPLKEARRVAQTQRQALVARAKALSPDARGGEMVAQVRELQAQWQQHARTLPLARPIEAALWTDFKAATDAVFAQREAAFSARDVIFKENETARVALIERLENLGVDTPLADIKRSVAEVDSAWRHAGEASRANGAALDARYRAARADAQALITGHAQRLWQAHCDALLDTLTLREAQTSQEAHSNGDADAALLQLEIMLDLPSPAEHQAARREFKLLAMKAALEGRQAPGPATGRLDPLIAKVLGPLPLSAAQCQRLRQLLSALRAGSPRN
ncbi:MAG: DUF349 domain-containing protein [Burkholderiales bacterium]|nr:DUF349 domain-containing protein [Burkholderiales bacterium]